MAGEGLVEEGLFEAVERGALIASLVDVKEQRDVAHAFGWRRREWHRLRHKTGTHDVAVAVLEIVS